MRRYVSTEDATISELERRVEALTAQRDELAERMVELEKDSVKKVLFRGRGGRMQCGEFLSFVDEDRLRIRTAPGTVVPNTVIKEEHKLSPEELCAEHNLLRQQLEDTRNAYHAAQEEAISLRVYVGALEEANDALRSQLPTYGSKVEKWMRGDAVAL